MQGIIFSTKSGNLLDVLLLLVVVDTLGLLNTGVNGLCLLSQKLLIHVLLTEIQMLLKLSTHLVYRVTIQHP